MLNSVKKLRGVTAAAIDGEVGTIKDVYFDDDKWTIRYFIIETGGWFTGRTVLISPLSVLGADWPGGGVRLNLTREQIKNGPDIDTDKPVSRQHEAELLNHYGYPYYWAVPLVWGYTADPTIQADRASDYADGAETQRMKEQRNPADPHLRSGREVAGYQIQATDGSVGHVEDFMFDSDDWSIQLMVVDTRNWLPGKHVLISPQRIDRVDWASSKVFVNVTRDHVEHSPEFDSMNQPPREARSDLYRNIGGSFY
jgi:uncharacterized protein YrrD